MSAKHSMELLTTGVYDFSHKVRKRLKAQLLYFHFFFGRCFVQFYFLSVFIFVLFSVDDNQMAAIGISET